MTKKELYQDFIIGLSISELSNKYKVSKTRVYKEIAEYSKVQGKTINELNINEAMKSLHTIAFNTQFIAGMNFGNELRAIEQVLLKVQEVKKDE